MPRGFELTAETSDSGLQKIDESSGEIKDALTQVDRTEEHEQNHTGRPRELPEISTIAVAPTGEVYLHFEHPFIYRDVPRDAEGARLSKGYQCQIFMIRGGSLDDLLVNAPAPDNLECIDNQHVIDNWRHFPNGVFQFDAAGNIYYPGSLPHGGKMVVYKRDRLTGKATEMINANICVQNFLVTDSGALFYTGNTCQDNNQGGGGGFFRYIAPGKTHALSKSLATGGTLSLTPPSLIPALVKKTAPCSLDQTPRIDDGLLGFGLSVSLRPKQERPS